MSPKDSQITKIQVWHNDIHINGFKMFSNDVVVLRAGRLTNQMIEVPLEAGEKFVAIRSKIYDKQVANDSIHCNLVLVLGKLA